ncbi:MAG TPA: serine/threonine-protein kinase, partial [Anaeromyxobacteraceae bacterium]|nr:serine/threonine-protein kinase [Anaeromyxobacteraceae bacterium]
MRAFGKYRLVEPIASGGMAEVWRAEAPGAEGFVKEVALKLVRGDHDARGEFVRMFIQEARLASRLTHANIVQVFEFDQVDGRYYIAMELVRGRTLREVVDRCREQGLRLGVPRAVHVGAEVARALAYAHRLQEGGRPAGLVHRDVSPQNVLVSFEGEVKLTDFGIARALGATEATAPGTLKGKLAYMAPEQARGGAVDGRADVFALGVVLWELCTGRRLFARESDAATLAAVLADEPVSPPSAWNEGVPADLDACVLAALERDPGRRTASAEALADALAALRLRLAARHEDLDLRALMRRLWPQGDGPTPPRPASETVVREPSAGGERSGPTATTVARPVAARAPRRRAAAAVAFGLVVAGTGVAWWARRAGEGGRNDVTVPSPRPSPADAGEGDRPPTSEMAGAASSSSPSPTPSSNPTPNPNPNPNPAPRPSTTQAPPPPTRPVAPARPTAPAHLT